MDKKTIHPFTQYICRAYKDIDNFNALHADKCPKWKEGVLVEFDSIPVCRMMSALSPDNYLRAMIDASNRKRFIEKLEKETRTEGKAVFSVHFDSGYLGLLAEIMPDVHKKGRIYAHGAAYGLYVHYSSHNEYRYLSDAQLEKIKKFGWL